MQLVVTGNVSNSDQVIKLRCWYIWFYTGLESSCLKALFLKQCITCGLMNSIFKTLGDNLMTCFSPLHKLWQNSSFLFYLLLYSWIYNVVLIFSYTHTYILLKIIFHYGLSQDIEYSSLCNTSGPCCLSILYTIACIC